MPGFHQVRHRREPAILRLHRLLERQVLEVECLTLALHFPHLVDVLFSHIASALPSPSDRVYSCGDQPANRAGGASDLRSQLKKTMLPSRSGFILPNRVREPPGSARNSRWPKRGMSGVGGSMR